MVTPSVRIVTVNFAVAFEDALHRIKSLLLRLWNGLGVEAIGDIYAGMPEDTQGCPFCPEIMRYAARLLFTDAGDWTSVLQQDDHHQEGCTHRSAVLLLMVSSRGQIGVKARTLC